MNRSENITLLYNCLITHGGGSYNICKGILNPDTGYMVAVQGKEKIIDLPANAEAFRDQIIKYSSQHHTEVFSENNYLGVWINPDTGKVCLDISERVFDKEEAMRLGRERAQIAIYDNVAHETINIKFVYVQNLLNTTHIHLIKT